MLREDDGFLVLQVSDTGIGISREDQRRVFDKFYRVESEATEKIGGSNLFYEQVTVDSMDTPELMKRRAEAMGSSPHPIGPRRFQAQA